MPNIENNTMSTFTIGGKTFEIEDASARSNIQQINTVLDTKADTSDMSNYYIKSETYNKSEVDSLISNIDGGGQSGGDNSGLTNEIKDALLACFAEVVWATQNGQTLYNQLEEALEEALGYYTITKNLGNATSTDTKTKIIKNETYTDTFSPKLNYEITDITCTMGGISQSIINNNNGTYTINISEVIGDIIITIITSENISGVLHFVDFTQSLVDQVTGDTVTPCANSKYSSTPPTRNSNGLSFTGIAQYVPIAQVTFPCTIEMKVGACAMTGTAGNNRLIMLGAAFDTDGMLYTLANGKGPFIYHAGGSNRWAAYNGSWADYTTRITARDDIADSIIKIYIDANGVPHLTVNGVSYGTANISFLSTPYLQLGTASNGDLVANLTVEYIKVYDGEV